MNSSDVPYILIVIAGSIIYTAYVIKQKFPSFFSTPKKPEAKHNIIEVKEGQNPFYLVCPEWQNTDVERSQTIEDQPSMSELLGLT